MVMHNDQAKKRHGVKLSYKKVKGFQPLQLVWDRFIVDAVFRSGDRQCNYGEDPKRMIRRAVEGIRSHYDAEVPIVVRIDSGFLDQELFKACGELAIGHVCGGRIYDSIREILTNCPEEGWGLLDRKSQQWRYFEFGSRCKVWKRFRRAIFCQPMYENRQRLQEFARPDTVIYTNLGRGEEIDHLLRDRGHQALRVRARLSPSITNEARMS